jgi:tetratricopeptide (TPR) repeat protein
VKIFLNVIAIVVLAAGWGHFFIDRGAAAEMQREADAASLVADFVTVDAKHKASDELESRAVFTGILLAFLSAGYVGILFVAYILPALANKFTHAVYDSGELVEHDAMRDARSLIAQGDYAGAVEAFREATLSDPGNRVPWVEIAKLQREQLDDSEGAVATLREALENHPWGEDDSGFLLFRLADVYADGLGDFDGAAEILGQLIEQFPETRHSANARHRLQEWGRGVACA